MTKSMTPEQVIPTHPIWCEQGAECVDVGDGAEHMSHQTSFLAMGKDAMLRVDLRRIDGLDGAWDRGESRVCLGIENRAAINSDGSSVYADVYLSREEVRILQTFLSRYDAMLAGRHFEMPTRG